MSVFTGARPPVTTLASLRRLTVAAARRHRFGIDRLVLVDRGSSHGPLEDDIARRLSHVTGWDIARLGASGFGPAEVARRIEVLGGRPPALVVGPDILQLGSLALRAEAATLRRPWPMLSVLHHCPPGWMPRILVRWSRGGLAREVARAAWATSQALDGLVFSVQLHEVSSPPTSPPAPPGPPLRFRSWTAPRHRVRSAGPAQLAELRRVIAVFGPDLILVDPGLLPQLARCGAGPAGSGRVRGRPPRDDGGGQSSRLSEEEGHRRA